MSTLETILQIKVEGTDSMVKLKSEIDKTTTELKELKNAQKAAGADGKKYNAEILTMETRLKGMKKEMVGAKNDTLKMNAAMSAQGKSYNDLTKQNAALSVQLRKLGDPLGKNKKEFEALSGKMNQNTNALKKMDAQMGRQQRNVGNYGGAIKGMALQLGAAIMAFKALERVISTFSDFQFAIKQVGVISGATAAEMEMLEQQAKDLGSSTAFTAGEVAKLQIEFAKLGFDAGDIENMTSSVLDLSFAFGDELNVTAEQVGITLKSFNLDASEASRVTDVMAAAFSNSALDLSKFATAMPKVASIASTMGFTLEDTTSILGMLANTGMEASTAGTSLKNIFLKLADPAGDLAQALGRNVTSVEELIPALKELDKKGIDVAGMLEITDRRSVTAFASLLKGADKLAILNKTLKTSQGITKKFADTMRNSLKGNLDATASAAEGLVIELVDGLEPVLNMVLYVLQGLLGVFRFLTPVIVSVAAGFAAYGIVLLGTKLKTIALNAATKLFGTTTITLNGIMKLARAAMLAFNKAVSANPIGLLVAGLAAAVTLFYQFADSSGEASSELEGLNEQREKFNKIDQDGNNQMADQLANVKSLISVIGDQTKSMKDRNKALEDLNKIHPITITNLKDEKKLTQELEQAYKDIADAIKAEIVMSVAKEKVKELLKEQLALEQEINVAQEGQLKTRLAVLGVTNDISEDGKILGAVWDSNTNAFIENADAVQFLADNWVEGETKIIKTHGMYDKAAATHNQALMGEFVTTGLLTGATEKHAEIQTQVNDILAEATDYVNELDLEIKSNSKSVGDNTTEYEKLKNAVSDATKELQEAITTNGDVATATDNLKKAKKDLAVVDDQVTKIIKKNDDELKGSVDGLKIRIEKLNETLAAEQKELKMLDDLQSAGAKLAKEQIEQSLAVAEAKLKLYMMDITMSNNSTATQVENITKLQNKIKGFNATLSKMSDENSEGAPAGWLNKNLFGTGGEDGQGGEGFTGADMVAGIATTLGAVMDIMAGYNEMINTQSEERVNTMTQEKNTEIANFKKTAAFEVMTQEQKDQAILDIEKRHDTKILAEKVKMFEKNQQFMIAQSVMGGAMAIMQIWSSSATGNAIADAIIKGIMTAAMVGLTGLQIATIKSQKPPTAEFGGVLDNDFFAQGGMVHGPSHDNGGVKFKVGGRVAELEGGEAVINKRSTAMFKPQLSAMNQAGGGKKFADGGLTFATDMLQDQSLAMASALDSQDTKQVLMVEADVTSSQLSVENIEAQATF